MKLASLPATPQALCILGGPRSGKTTRLAQHVRGLVRDGADVGSVLVLAAAPRCACGLSTALAKEGEVGEGEGVRTVRELALEVLATPEARAFTGRKPRVLDEVGERFLSEDMQLSTYKRRLRRGLEAFLRGNLALLADDDPDWLATPEEDGYLRMMRGKLAFYTGMLEEEVSNLAVKFLRQDAEALARFSRAHVAVDDYGLLCRASQMLVNMLARESVAVAADPAAALRAFEAHPYPYGLQEFCARNADARVVELSDGAREQKPAALVLERVRSAIAQPATSHGDAGHARALEQDGPAGPPAAGVSARVYPNVAKELDGIAQAVERAIAQGTPPERIFITCTSEQWRKNLGRTLAKRGIALASPERVPALRGDLRDEHSCHAARRATLARLAADAQDGAAWRAWLGFGDYMGRSAQVATLQEQARGMTLPEALEALDALDANGAGAEDGACGLAVEDHAKLLALYRLGKQLLAQGIEPESGDGGKRSEGVLLGPPTEARGREFDVVVWGGFVNGLMPRRGWFDPEALVGKARERTRQEDLQQLYLVLGRARTSVLFTAFTAGTLEFAEKLDLRITRIKAKDGRRVCSLEPSIYLGLLGL